MKHREKFRLTWRRCKKNERKKKLREIALKNKAKQSDQSKVETTEENQQQEQQQEQGQEQPGTSSAPN